MRMRSSLSPHTRASSDEKKAPETCAYVASAHAVQGGQPQEDSKTALAREGWRGGKQNRANQRSDRGSGESRQREEGEPNVPMSGEHTAENGGRFVTAPPEMPSTRSAAAASATTAAVEAQPQEQQQQQQQHRRGKRRTAASSSDEESSVKSVDETEQQRSTRPRRGASPSPPAAPAAAPAAAEKEPHVTEEPNENQPPPADLEKVLDVSSASLDTSLVSNTSTSSTSSTSSSSSAASYSDVFTDLVLQLVDSTGTSKTKHRKRQAKLVSWLWQKKKHTERTDTVLQTAPGAGGPASGRGSSSRLCRSGLV